MTARIARLRTEAKAMALIHLDERRNRDISELIPVDDVRQGAITKAGFEGSDGKRPGFTLDRHRSRDA